MPVIPPAPFEGGAVLYLIGNYNAIRTVLE